MITDEYLRIMVPLHCFPFPYYFPSHLPINTRLQISFLPSGTVNIRIWTHDPNESSGIRSHHCSSRTVVTFSVGNTKSSQPASTLPRLCPLFCCVLRYLKAGIAVGSSTPAAFLFIRKHIKIRAIQTALEGCKNNTLSKLETRTPLLRDPLSDMPRHTKHSL